MLKFTTSILLISLALTTYSQFNHLSFGTVNLGIHQDFGTEYFEGLYNGGFVKINDYKDNLSDRYAITERSMAAPGFELQAMLRFNANFEFGLGFGTQNLREIGIETMRDPQGGTNIIVHQVPGFYREYAYFKSKRRQLFTEARYYLDKYQRGWFINGRISASFYRHDLYVQRSLSGTVLSYSLDQKEMEFNSLSGDLAVGAGYAIVKHQKFVVDLGLQLNLFRVYSTTLANKPRMKYHWDPKNDSFVFYEDLAKELIKVNLRTAHTLSLHLKIGYRYEKK